jgi:hypothetical protein
MTEEGFDSAAGDVLPTLGGLTSEMYVFKRGEAAAEEEWCRLSKPD